MRVHHRSKPLFLFSVDVFGCALAHAVKYISYCDQGQENQEVTDLVQLPHLTEEGGEENLRSRS